MPKHSTQRSAFLHNFEYLALYLKTKHDPKVEHQSLSALAQLMYNLYLGTKNNTVPELADNQERGHSCGSVSVSSFPEDRLFQSSHLETLLAGAFGVL